MLRAGGGPATAAALSSPGEATAMRPLPAAARHGSLHPNATVPLQPAPLSLSARAHTPPPPAWLPLTGRPPSYSHPPHTFWRQWGGSSGARCAYAVSAMKVMFRLSSGGSDSAALSTAATAARASGDSPARGPLAAAAFFLMLPAAALAAGFCSGGTERWGSVTRGRIVDGQWQCCGRKAARPSWCYWR